MIDLSQYIGKTVQVQFRDGSCKTGVIRWCRGPIYNFYFEVAGEGSEYYTGSGLYFTQREDSLDIVAINELAVKPETLSALQKRKTQLEAELEEVEQQISVESGPRDMIVSEVFNFLNKRDITSVSLMFDWRSTPQGWDHWNDIRHAVKAAGREDIEYLLNCLSKHFLQEFD